MSASRVHVPVCSVWVQVAASSVLPHTFITVALNPVRPCASGLAPPAERRHSTFAASKRMVNMGGSGLELSNQ